MSIGDLSIEKIQSGSAALSLKNSNPFLGNKMSLNKPWKVHKKTNTPYLISKAFFSAGKRCSQGR